VQGPLVLSPGIDDSLIAPKLPARSVNKASRHLGK
jgi:hypothetical protein